MFEVFHCFTSPTFCLALTSEIVYNIFSVNAAVDKTTRELKAAVVAPEGLFGFCFVFSLLMLSISFSLSRLIFSSCVISSNDNTTASFNVLRSGYVLEAVFGKFNLTFGSVLKSLKRSTLSASSQSPWKSSVSTLQTIKPPKPFWTAYRTLLAMDLGES